MLRRIGESIRASFSGPAALLFFAALILYLPGIWWGATHATAATRVPPWGSDELAPLQPVTEVYGVFLARHPVFNPQYPLFQNVMQALFVAPYVLVLWLTGKLVHPTPIYPYGLLDPVSTLRTMTLLARAMSLLMAAGVVLVAYHTARILWNRTAAVMTGTLVLTIYPMFYYARTSNVDMGALFWTSLGLLVFAQCLRNAPNVRRAVWLGVFAGLATGTKDASWPAFLMIAAVLLYRHFENRGTAVRAGYKWMTAGLMSAAVTYVAASGLIFRPSRYISHLRWITRDGLQGFYRLPPTARGYLRLSLDVIQNLIDALGVPVMVCVIAGIALSVRHDRKLLAWLFPPAGIVLFVLVPARYVLLRFVLVIAYALAFFAAFLFYHALKSPAGRRVAMAFFPVIVGFSLIRGADLTYQMLYDSRYEAGVWFHRNAQAGARILHFTNASNLPPLDSVVRNIAVGGNSRYVFNRNRDDPEFVLLIPIMQFASESEHERNLPESDYAALRDGSLGYRQILSLQTRRLFFRRPIPFVNPRLQLFARNDLQFEQ